MGYNSRYIVQNFGTLCWTIFIAPLGYIFTSVLSWILKGEFTQKYRSKMKNLMFYDYWISFFNETFLFLSVCTALNFGYFRWKQYGDAINSFLSIFFAVFLVLYILHVSFFYILKYNYKKILNRDTLFLAKFGSILKDLNFKRQKKKVFIHLAVALVRKLSLAYVLVY